MSHPLTGVQADGWPSELPALAVKIGNNDARSLPQVGLEAADIVYETHIENGVTRFLAIFHSQVPETVGMIRSARSGDIDLLSNLKVPYLAYWGGNEGVEAELRQAEELGALVTQSALSWPRNLNFVRYFVCCPEYGYPLLSTPGVLTSVAPGVTRLPPDPVFDYGDLSGSAVPAEGVRWTTPNRQIDYVWDDSSSRWLRFQDGMPLLDANGEQLGADNVLMLYVFYTQSVADPKSPKVLSTGSGAGRLFRDGTVTSITWDRPGNADGWDLAESYSSKVAELGPGTTWVGLIKAGEMQILDSTEVAALID